eukprot:1577624-Amphidinium_carterae.3
MASQNKSPNDQCKHGRQQAPEVTNDISSSAPRKSLHLMGGGHLTALSEHQKGPVPTSLL